MAATTAGRETVYVRDLLESLSLSVTGPTPLLLDSKSAIDLAFDPVAFKKTKHVLRHAYWLRDVVARCVLHPTFVPTADQLADVFTKSLPPAEHRIALRRFLFAATHATLAASARIRPVIRTTSGGSRVYPLCRLCGRAFVWRCDTCANLEPGELLVLELAADAADARVAAATTHIHAVAGSSSGVLHTHTNAFHLVLAHIRTTGDRHALTTFASVNSIARDMVADVNFRYGAS